MSHSQPYTQPWDQAQVRSQLSAPQITEGDPHSFSDPSFGVAYGGASSSAASTLGIQSGLGASPQLGFGTAYPQTGLLGATLAHGTQPTSTMPHAGTSGVGGFGDDDEAHGGGSDVDGDPDDMMAAFLPPAAQ